MAKPRRYQTKAGPRWYVPYRKPDGKQSVKRGFTTARDANLWQSQMLLAKNRGEFVSHNAGRVTVGQLYPDWIAVKQATTRESHHRTLVSSWKNHVGPVWENVAVSKVDRLSVERWLAKMTAQNLGASGVKRALGILAGVMDDAVKGGHVNTNKARGCDGIPRKQSKAKVFLTVDQVKALADAAGEHRLLVLLLAYTGLRWSEAIHLHWADVDLAKKRLTVDEGAVQLGSRFVLDTPKHAKRRTVAIPQFLADELAAALVPGTGANLDLVFPGKDGNHLPRPKKNGWLSRACADAGLQRLTPHNLRDAYASLAVSGGANVLVLARSLGHSDPSVTLRVYAQLFDADLDSVGDALDRLATADRS
ncbi:site-specific integrase [Mycolicibacter kumamotonensis]|uniref:Tyr recombinase domain-containing protein n=1 Tax=Mycolicibacter kumamotonensis TaxID=354243 RepID=A0A1B8SCQ8_9MYCO|nr:site-specific integrase [Mycolicibacter kumamotonensis]OBY30497.1 hypothetical protein ACT18_17295 [Mycolicibacter kumamotonensis]